MHRAYWSPQVIGDNAHTKAKTAPQRIFVFGLLAFYILPELDIPAVGTVIRSVVKTVGIALPYGVILTTLFFLTSQHAQSRLTRIPPGFLIVLGISAFYLFLQFFYFLDTLDATALRAVIATLSAPIIVIGTFVIAPYLPWQLVLRITLVAFVLSFIVFLNRVLGLGLHNQIIEFWTEVWFFKVLPAYKSDPGGLPGKAYTPTIASEGSHEVFTYFTILLLGYVAMRRHAISKFAWLFIGAAFLFMMFNNGSRSALFVIVISAVAFYLLNLLASYQQSASKTIFHLFWPPVVALILYQIPVVYRLVNLVIEQWNFLHYWADTHYGGEITADTMKILVGPRFYPMFVHINTPLYYPIGFPITTSTFEMYDVAREKFGMDPLKTAAFLPGDYVQDPLEEEKDNTDRHIDLLYGTHARLLHALHANLSPRTWLTYTWAYLGIFGYLITLALFAYSAVVTYLLFRRNEIILAAVLLTALIASSTSTGVGATQLYFVFGLICAIAHGHLYLPPRNVSGKFLSKEGVLR